MVPDGLQNICVADSEAVAEDGSGDWAVEQDRVRLVRRGDGQARFSGEGKLCRGTVRPKEIMPPDGELHAFRIDVPTRGEICSFDEDALDVTPEPGRTGGELTPDAG
jgi:hypothetical protein